MRIKCFLTEEEEKDIQSWIKEMEQDRERDFTESGGLGVRVERAGNWAIYDIYRVIGQVEISKKEVKE